MNVKNQAFLWINGTGVGKTTEIYQLPLPLFGFSIIILGNSYMHVNIIINFV